GFNFDTIVNTNDSVYGSLRQFLLNANGLANAGLVQQGLAPGIEHAIWMIPNGTDAPGLRAGLDYSVNGAATIHLHSPLPSIVQPLVLDASREPGFQGRPVVAIDGADAGATDGLALAAPGCGVRGLIIGNFQGSGIQVQDVDAHVAGCWIGLDPAGTAAWANGNGVT